MRSFCLSRNSRPDPELLPVVRGQGIYFWDESGRMYYDFASQTLNLLLGQCHPAVVSEISRQASTLTFASSRFGTPVLYEAAEMLLSLAPRNMASVNLKMCNGSDANETAVKTARKVTGRQTIVSFYGAHTGQSAMTIRLRGDSHFNRRYLGPIEDVVFLPPPDCHRCWYGKRSSSCGLECATALERLVTSRPDSIAGILIDPVMVSAGVLVSQRTGEYLQLIQSSARQAGVLVIMDESQSFGWVPEIFASRHFAIEPDIITLGKGLSSGHPISACLFSKDYGEALSYNEADYTHGAHPLSLAAMKATLHTLASEDFAIEEKGQVLSTGFQELSQRFKFLADIRRLGLIVGIKCDGHAGRDATQVAKAIYAQSLQRGLYFRVYADCLVFKPPIVVSIEQINEALEIFRKAVEHVGGVVY